MLAADHARKNARQVQRLRCAFDSPTLRLRQDEQVLYQPVEPVRLRLQILEQILARPLVEADARCSPALRATVDRRNRRAQLVADDAVERLAHLVGVSFGGDEARQLTPREDSVVERALALGRSYRARSRSARSRCDGDRHATGDVRQ